MPCDAKTVGRGVKSRHLVTENLFMLFLLFLLTALYFACVVWVLRAKRRRAGAVVPCLPEDDQPPVSAVGWPPEGDQFTDYVDEGFAALDAYRSSALPPEIG
jgi:cbb3-type cytochrome oxidase subunit 3